MSVWRWIAVVLVGWFAPPLIARTARAISARERRKKGCAQLMMRVRELLEEEFPGAPVIRPVTPFSWFTQPELLQALVTSKVFALVLTHGQVTTKDVEYVARYGSRIGCDELRIYVHESSPVWSHLVAAEQQVVSIRGVRDCPCTVSEAASASGPAVAVA